jgi:cytochrome b561
MFSKFGSWKRFQTLSSKTFSTINQTIDAYPGTMQAMHWTMGGAIIACVGCVQGAIYTKDKKLKGDLMFYHKSFGLLSLGFLFPRLALRAVSKIPEHLPGPAWELISAKVTHGLLYAFMIIMPISGTIMGYYSGKGLPFFWKTLDGAPKADGATAKQAFQIHKQVGSYLQYVVPLHAGAVGYHFIVKGKNILPRILPWGKA